MGKIDILKFIDMHNIISSKPEFIRYDGMHLRSLAGPDYSEEDFNLYGFILYDELDDVTADFMSKYGGWISSVTGDNCWITIFENPAQWGDYWKFKAKEFYGEKYEKILAKWKGRDPSYRNMSHKIASKLNIPLNMFPCIIFLKSLKSQNCSKPYPLINDEDFYKDLFGIVSQASNDTNITIEKLDKELMDKLKWKWFNHEKLGEKIELFNKYVNPVLDIVDRFLKIISQIYPK